VVGLLIVKARRAGSLRSLAHPRLALQKHDKGDLIAICDFLKGFRWQRLQNYDITLVEPQCASWQICRKAPEPEEIKGTNIILGICWPFTRLVSHVEGPHKPFRLRESPSGSFREPSVSS
jgi:hypothetical protein